MIQFKQYKNIVSAVLFLIGIVLTSTSVLYAEDYETPHRLKPGDVISADIFNEIFDYIEDTKRSTSVDDFVGVWTFKTYAHSGNESGQLWNEAVGTITFVDNGDGTYSTNSDPTPFQITYPSTADAQYDVKSDILFTSYYYTPSDTPTFAIGTYQINKICNTRIILTLLYSNANSTTKFIILDKVNTPPSIPNDLSLDAEGMVIMLNWTDNSDNETGFKIFRKDSLLENYSEIGTTTANITTYEDTVLGAGTYWYRVEATNSIGDSLGSNVVKVIITN